MIPAKKHTYTAILVNYNHATFLPAAIKGILIQSTPFDEILVIDDASTDNSIEVIEKLLQGLPNARLIRHPKNRGVVAASNTAMREATGDFIAFMAADDRYSPELVEWCEKLLDKYPDVAMISGNVRTAHADTGIEQVFTLPFPQELGAYKADDIRQISQKRAFTFFGGANVFRRSRLLQVGGQREALKWHADWFLYMQMACRYGFGVVPAELASLRRTAMDYSRASQDWRTQGPMIESLVRLIQQEYGEEYLFLRDCGLLPTYDMRTLPLLMVDGDLRDFLTPLLAWRLLTYQPLRAASQMVPENMKEELRRVARV